MKMVVLYKRPEDEGAFDGRYFGEHLDLNAKTPGLLRTEVGRFFDLRGNDPEHYLMAELYFEDREALTRALKSPEAKAAGAQLQSFAAGLASFSFVEVVE